MAVRQLLEQLAEGHGHTRRPRVSACRSWLILYPPPLPSVVESSTSVANRREGTGGGEGLESAARPSGGHDPDLVVVMKIGSREPSMALVSSPARGWLRRNLCLVVWAYSLPKRELVSFRLKGALVSLQGGPSNGSSRHDVGIWMCRCQVINWKP